MFGCPYNFYPEKPWLRRTIRGMIATGAVVASPIILAGAVTAAVTILPPFAIYKFVQHARARRRARALVNFPIGEPFLIESDLDDPQALAHAAFQFDLHGDLAPVDMMRVLRQIQGLSITQALEDDDSLHNDDEIDLNNFPLSIFAEMDIENLFSDGHNTDDKDELTNCPSDFRTCPTTPASTIRKGLSRSLNNIAVTNCTSLNRHHSMTTEH